MILEQQKDAVVMSVGDVSDSISMSLDLESAQILMQMLSKNLYADAIGSTIRETCSNALDSHRRAKIDDPILVRFSANNDNTYTFSVEDFGTGMDSNDVETIISKYGKSTKRLIENELGMMGLGFKSPLAYSSSFHFVCRKNGMEWKYMMYEGEDSNKIDLLYSQKTSERNGVKILIPVKSGDRYEFIIKTREQLAYFESVYFDVSGIGNDFTILRSEYYQHSPLVHSPNMHICLDNIYYPIDFAKLGILEINIAIGLRFTLKDGIFPTPNRESIRYSQEAKKTILERIEKVADTLITQYNQNIVETDDIDKIFAYYDSSTRQVTVNGEDYEIKPLLKFSKIKLEKPKMKGIDLLDLNNLHSRQDHIFSEYQIRYTIKNQKMSETKSKDDKEVDLSKINDRWYIFDETMGGRKKEYIKSLCSYNTYHLIKKVNHYTLGFNRRKSYLDRDQDCSYYYVLRLKDYPKDQWRQIITEFQTIQKIFIDRLKDIDAIEIPQEWLDARKRDRVSSTGDGRRIKLTGEIFGKTAVPLERYVSGKNCKFIAATYKLEDISKFNGLTIYDSYDNQDKLDNLYYISVRSKTNMRILSFSDREMKVLEKLDIHNLISFTKFMEGDNKPFKRLITAYLIDRLMDDYPNVFAKKAILSSISKSLVDKITLLQTYKNNNFKYADNKIYIAMLPVAEAGLLFDMSVYIDYLDLRDVFKKLVFLEPIMKNISNRYDCNDDPMIPVLVDLFKYYKHRIDYQNYKVSLNDDINLDDLLLTDEKVDELLTNI